MKALLREEFRIPLAVVGLLALGAVLPFAWIVATLVGITKIVRDSVEKIREGQYSLDYIAFLAMAVSLATDQHLAGGVVALMITGGEALDEYASRRAESALRDLADRIPKFCTVKLSDGNTEERSIHEIKNGDHILIRSNEIIPLDGVLRSEEALLNTANLTGESLPVVFAKGTFVKSGSINAGPLVEMTVEGSFETSTYMRIVKLIAEAKEHQPHVVRLAERVNFPFTAIAIALASGAYLLSGELSRALAVLVIATPCPLIIAAPVAFIGGLSRAARRNIIVKRPASLEVLDAVSCVFFDKTGTLTLGEPILSEIRLRETNRTKEEILSIAAAIEFHSIHPLARAIVHARHTKHAPVLEAHDVAETIGKGIEGTVNGNRFSISKSPEIVHDGILLSLYEGEVEIARLHLRDEMKENVSDLFHALEKKGIDTEMLTGDRLKHAEKLFGHLGIPIRADMTPEGKFAAIDAAKRQGKKVAMVGDGLNDGPALAHADIGIVFSGTENSASIEAAHAVILGRDVLLVRDLFQTAHDTMNIARQSVWGGVVLSVVGMGFAFFGLVPPVIGALIQEAIDITVILNSLRASRE